MEKLKSKWRNPPTATSAENLLEDYYSRLQKWGAILTRGDKEMAREIVHDLCLHFTVVKPDLSHVENLDGYLYTSLRHIYLSALARSSREAVQLVSVADFDSIQFALRAGSSETLVDRQNELRRICSYAVWRKDASKSASYFILHFFHGYARREVAAIACLPMAAIYNKLKIARTEVKAHLEASGKLRLATREAPSDPQLAVSSVSSAELFNELRQSIFDAKRCECPSEEALLGLYRAVIQKPIACGLLSHVVSCECCLALLGRHFQRPGGQDLQPPRASWSSHDGQGTGSAASDSGEFKALMRAVRWQRERIYEHRPSTLSIAVDGRIAALHDVQSERSTLASRIEHPENVQFVEVFTDQQIRLALLPIEELPPGGLHVSSQQVTLSDGRWLELKLSFDGLGLHSEVTYMDPTLAAGMQPGDLDEEMSTTEFPQRLPMPSVAGTRDDMGSLITRIASSVRAMTPRFALAWTMILAVFLGSAGYLAYRNMHAPLNASAMLNDSVRVEAAELKGKTAHRILGLDAIDAGGRTLWQGTVDVWQEPGSGRAMRKLYNARHRLLAAQWRGKQGQSGSYVAPNLAPMDSEVAASQLWEQSVSARAFQTMDAQKVRIRATRTDYELTGTDLSKGPPRLVSATLVLDRSLHFVGETLRLSTRFGIAEVRFVQARKELLPNASVPDSVFEPADLDFRLRGETAPETPVESYDGDLVGSDVRLVQAQVAVLYQLSKLGADVGEPIEVSRTSDGRIRVSGTVADQTRKNQIVSALESLPDHQLLEVRIASQSDLRIPVPAARATLSAGTSVYTVARTGAPADALLREYFAEKGLTADQVNTSVAKFSGDALEHAQLALENAYALDRLGASFTVNELRAMRPVSQEQWSAMVQVHASALDAELRELQRQLAPLVPGGGTLATGEANQIDTPVSFAHQTRELLHQTQDLNRAVGKAFSAGTATKDNQNAGFLIIAAMHSIPFKSAEQVSTFASRLSSSKSMAERAGKRDLGQTW